MSESKIPDSCKPLPDHLQNLPNMSSRCPKCGREVIRTWNCCPRCGSPLHGGISRIRDVTEAENASYLISGLISYHERISLAGRVEDGDCYANALRYALSLVELQFERDTQQENAD